jgi:hypothetical protein
MLAGEVLKAAASWSLDETTNLGPVGPRGVQASLLQRREVCPEAGARVLFPPGTLLGTIGGNTFTWGARDERSPCIYCIFLIVLIKEKRECSRCSQCSQHIPSFVWKRLDLDSCLSPERIVSLHDTISIPTMEHREHREHNCKLLRVNYLSH